MTFATLLMAWFGSAQGAPQSEAPADEEIIVWGDRFLRWDQRWHIETEVSFATPFQLFGRNNRELWLRGIQIRAVIGCQRQAKQGARQMVVGCAVEDIALVARAIPTRAGDVLSPDVLLGVDRTFTGAEVQLHAAAGGQVPHVDLEGIKTTNRRTRQRVEQMRQLALRMMVPFHLELPEPVQNGARWFEYQSRLMSMPSMQGTPGTMNMSHVMSEYQDHLMVQTIGKGTVRNGGVEVLTESGPAELAVEIYELEVHGVALFDPSNGIMVERVWSVTGGATASSFNTLSAKPYHHMGRIRMLGREDQVALGETRVVMLSDWEPLSLLE